MSFKFTVSMLLGSGCCESDEFRHERHRPARNRPSRRSILAPGSGADVTLGNRRQSSSKEPLLLRALTTDMGAKLI
jgi:hypothetical protein